MQFDKNKHSATYSLPFLRSKLPPDQKVIQSLLICEVKRTDTPNIWELKVRECNVGTSQERGIDFDESYYPTAEPLSIKSSLAVGASQRMFVGIIDIKNAFQTTLRDKNMYCYVSMVPYYRSWLYEIEGIQ